MKQAKCFTCCKALGCLRCFWHIEPLHDMTNQTVSNTKAFFLILKFLLDQGPYLWGHWYPLFQTSNDSAHGFQSPHGFIIACVLLWLVYNDPQSHLWLLRTRH